MESAKAFLRVIGNSIASHRYPDGTIGEVSRIKAVGAINFETDGLLPASLHFEAYPNCGVVPFTGDWIVVEVRRATAEEMQTMSPSYLLASNTRSGGSRALEDR